MTCKVVGTRRVDMEGERGEHIGGFSLFITHDEDGVTGVMAEKTFINDTWIRDHLGGWVPGPGDIVATSFNRRGKIVVDGPGEGKK